MPRVAISPDPTSPSLFPIAGPPNRLWIGRCSINLHPRFRRSNSHCGRGTPYKRMAMAQMTINELIMATFLLTVIPPFTSIILI